MSNRIRDALRRFYLRQQLKQIDMNEAHYSAHIVALEIEKSKLAAERVKVCRELQVLG